MTGSVLETFCEEINGGDSIGATLLFQLINMSKALVEQRRPWMLLRYTDTSKTVTASTNAWNSAIDISDIARLSRFYGETPIKIFDGTNRIDYYRQVPFNQRLEHRERAFSFVHDAANADIYLNGTVAAGTLWIDHIKNSPDIENTEQSEWVFPSWAHPLLGYMAVAMNKGGIDYDDVNARMAPENQARADQIMRMLENWDNELQLAAISQHDPSGSSEGEWRPNAINL